jgi:hypothetical protein
MSPVYEVPVRALKPGEEVPFVFFFCFCCCFFLKILPLLLRSPPASYPLFTSFRLT